MASCDHRGYRLRPLRDASLRPDAARVCVLRGDVQRAAQVTHPRRILLCVVATHFDGLTRADTVLRAW